MLTLVRLRANELRVGDLYVTGSAPAIKRRITALRPTVAPVGGALAAAVELRCADGTTPLVLADQGVRTERDLRPLGSVTSAQRHEFSACAGVGGLWRGQFTSCIDAGVWPSDPAAAERQGWLYRFAHVRPGDLGIATRGFRWDKPNDPPRNSRVALSRELGLYVFTATLREGS
jgi:hypothetical protein